MKKKIFLLLLLIGILLTACGASPKFESSSPSVQRDITPSESPAESMETSGAEEVTNDLNIPSGRKIIVTYSLNLETQEYDKTMEQINSAINSFSGIRSSMQENNYNARQLNLTVQIPSEKATEFVSQIANIETLKVKENNLNSEDVTDKYLDTELRLKTLREKLTRLQQLQAEQPDLESLLMLETEISNTILEIERIEGQLRSMDSRIDYTSVSIYLYEIIPYVSTYTRPNFGSRLTAAFGQSIDNFVYGVQDLIIGVIYALPYIVILLIIVVLIKVVYGKFFKGKFPKSPLRYKGKKRIYGEKTETNEDIENKVE